MLEATRTVTGCRHAPHACRHPYRARACAPPARSPPCAVSHRPGRGVGTGSVCSNANPWGLASNIPRTDNFSRAQTTNRPGMVEGVGGPRPCYAVESDIEGGADVVGRASHVCQFEWASPAWGLRRSSRSLASSCRGSRSGLPFVRVAVPAARGGSTCRAVARRARPWPRRVVLVGIAIIPWRRSKGEGHLMSEQGPRRTHADVGAHSLRPRGITGLSGRGRGATALVGERSRGVLCRSHLRCCPRPRQRVSHAQPKERSVSRHLSVSSSRSSGGRARREQRSCRARSACHPGLLEGASRNPGRDADPYGGQRGARQIRPDPPAAARVLAGAQLRNGPR